MNVSQMQAAGQTTPQGCPLEQYMDPEPTADELRAIAIYRRKVPSEKRNLRAFFHDHYGQWWIYEKNWIERQIGCVLQDECPGPAA